MRWEAATARFVDLGVGTFGLVRGHPTNKQRVIMFRAMGQGAEVGLRGVDWKAAVKSLERAGWVRLEAAVDARTCTLLFEAVPGNWSPLVEDEGVDQGGGGSCHVDLACAAPIVQSFGQTIRSGVNAARSRHALELPEFNHAQWGKSANGVGFITAHRDPPGAGGIIAITTLSGRARFHVWDDDGISQLPPAQHDQRIAHEWETSDGDLVLLRGNGWPNQASRCPVHEVESPIDGERMILTLRHNKGGYGSDYFTSPVSSSVKDQ